MRKPCLSLGKVLIVLIVLTACRDKEFTAVFSSSAGPVVVRLELAVTPEERRRGLMFRDRIGDREGMLFCFDQDGRHSFWMKNTYVSLDIVFLSVEGVVVDTLESLPPCPMDPCPSYTPEVEARYALEVQAGFVKQHDVRTGDRVRLDLAGDHRPARP